MGSRQVSVKLSGPAVSLLIYENMNTANEQEGFLLGNITKIITKCVTDDSREQVKIKEIININGILPCDLPTLCYYNDGALNTEKLNEILGNKKKNVVAWFKYNKFRRNGFRFTLRERVLHEEYCKFFNIPSHLFTCCILAFGASDNHSTLVYSHAFVNLHDNQLKMIPMHIENLGDQCHTYQQNIKPSEEFMAFFNTIDKNQTDLQLGKNIHNKLQSELKNSIVDVASSEQILTQLLSEVDALNKKLKRLQLKKNLLSPDNKTVSSIDIDVPIDFEPKILSENNILDATIDLISDKEETQKLDKSEDVLDKTANFVDLTLSEEDEDKSVKKTRNARGRPAKVKRGALKSS